jgi:cytochrome c oxidase subunit 4
MSIWAVLAVWLLLLALLAIEFLLSAIPGAQFAPPIVGVAMAVLVSVTFMRLASTRGVATIAAMAGVFWIGILLGMGLLDPLTRHDIRFETGQNLIQGHADDRNAGNGGFAGSAAFAPRGPG